MGWPELGHLLEHGYLIVASSCETYLQMRLQQIPDFQLDMG